jgi:integrase
LPSELHLISPSIPRTPSLRRHKPSGLAVVTLNGTDHYLGAWPPGKRKAPPATRDAYDRLIAEWLANGRRPPSPEGGQPAVAVNEVILAFWRWAEQHYRREDGTATNELGEYRYSLRPLRELCGPTLAADFSPLKLKAVRQRMIAGGWSRGLINRRVSRIVHLFKWAVSEELAPEGVWRALTTVSGLERGRTEARETEPVRPVQDADVDAVLPFALPPVRAMIQLQRLTGARPGEVCTLRACDIDMSGAVWLYRPSQHKTRHKGKERVVALGPQAQAVVKPFLKLDTQAHLFSPRDGLAEVRAERRRKRKTPVQPCQRNRRKARPKRVPRDRYTTIAYDHAIYAACDRAFPPPAPLGRRPDETQKAWLGRLSPAEREELARWRKEHRWHPHQLRHTHATEVRRRYGLEAAQVALGHSTAKVTEVYAERDLTLAVRVASEVG